MTSTALAVKKGAGSHAGDPMVLGAYDRGGAGVFGDECVAIGDGAVGRASNEVVVVATGGHPVEPHRVGHDVLVVLGDHALGSQEERANAHVLYRSDRGQLDRYARR